MFLKLNNTITDRSGDSNLYLPEGTWVEFLSFEDDYIIVEIEYYDERKVNFPIEPEEVSFTSEPLGMIATMLAASLAMVPSDWDYVMEIEELASIAAKLYSMGVRYENA